MVPATQARTALRDVVYDTAKPDNRLDLFVPSSTVQPAPVILWIHGGGWTRGARQSGWGRATDLTAQGYALVTVGYQLGAGLYRQQAADIGQAVSWVRTHAGDHGLDGCRIFLLGHSSGAHLAALAALATDLSGIPENQLAGVVLLDSAVYDIAALMSHGGAQVRALYGHVFGDDPADWRAASPMTWVRDSQLSPPFFIAHVARRPGAETMSRAFASALRSAQGLAVIEASETHSHMSMADQFGAPDDPLGAAALRFLAQQPSTPGCE